jgi:thiamine-phosphate pyrophosphorylase
MPLNLPQPIIYLITSGATTPVSSCLNEDFRHLLALVSAAVEAGIPLIQLREKSLNSRTLYELTVRCVELTRGTMSRLIVNDRADIARAARADGVHLTRRSLDAAIIRRTFGPDFLIGVSTHTLSEAQAARASGADFAVFGPVFDTPSKRIYGSPAGLGKLSEVARSLSPFPLFALGGITSENALDALRAGASGVAAIQLFSEPERLCETAAAIRAGTPYAQHQPDGL